MKRSVTKILLALLAILITGCNTGGPKVHVEPKIDANLPIPQNVITLSDVESIAFEWEKVEDTNIHGFVIYRSEDEGKLLQVGRINSRFSTHYVDSGLKPNQKYNYRISTYAANDFQSEPTESIIVRTNNIPSEISYVNKIDRLPRMAKLIFRPHTDPAINGYIIERQTPVKREWQEIAKLDGRLNAEFIDYNLQDEMEYKYRVFAVRFDGIRSYPSAVISTVTKKLPKNIQNIKASTILPKKIKVSWEQPASDNKLIYNIYTSDKHDGTFKKRASIKDTGVYMDTYNNDGHVVYYKVTAVDHDGLESNMPEISVLGSTKVKPLTPTIVSAVIVDSVPVIEWASNDKNVVGYRVLRTKKVGYFSKENSEYKNITGKTFEDTNEGFEPNVEFTYSVIAIDYDGIESVPSEKVSLIHSVKKEGLGK